MKTNYILIDIEKIEKWIPEGFVDSDIIDSIQKAKQEEKEKILINENRYNDIIDKSIKKITQNSQPKAEEPIKCPKCKSTQITAEKKGYSAGKALAGALVTGGIGLLAGFHGAGNIKVICLKCGNSWTPKG